MAASIAMGFCACHLNAQTSSPAAEPKIESTKAPDYKPFSLTVDAGTTGLGGIAGWRFSDHLGLHAGMDYLTYSQSGKIEDVTYDAKLKLMSETVALDVFPWESSSFHVSLGALFNQNNLSGHAAGDYSFDGNDYTGSLSVSIKQQPVDPYISIGGNLFYFDHGHHLSMFGELGVAYTGKGRVSLTTGGAATDAPASVVAEQKKKIEDAIDNVPVWPILKLGITWSF
jgi:hypothetical protein